MGTPTSRKDKKSSSPKRDGKGRFPPGVSGNPGGLPPEVRELRQAFLKDVPRAIRKVRSWLKSDEFPKQRAAVHTILERGLGAPAKPSELPGAAPLPEVPPEAADTTTILHTVRGMLARSVAGLQQRMAAGEMGMEEVATLGKLGHTLAELLKAEKEAAKASELGKYTDEELLAQVFAHVPLAKLRQAFLEREAKEKAPPGPGGGG
jgi:hypothetical protein